MRNIIDIFVFGVVFLSTNLIVSRGDRLDDFYRRLQQDDVKKCQDSTRLLPDCKRCIPGLQEGKDSKICNEYIKDSQSIRNEISTLTKERYGPHLDPKRPFGLYPCKKEDFID